MMSSTTSIRRLCQTLEQAGIACRIVHRRIRDTTGVASSGRDDLQVLVADTDAAAAAIICRRFHGRLASEPRQVRLTAGGLCCGHCGESVGETDQACTACSHKLG